MIVDKNSLDKVAGQAFVDMYGDYTPLNEITEEQAGQIVDSIEYDENIRLFSDYLSNEWITSAIKSLHSLIKSKGWFTSNPVSLDREKMYRDLGDTFTADGILKSWQQAESRTLHNPVIFKVK